MSEHASDRALAALQRIYDRPQPPVPWRHGGNLPWDDPAFSERMLKEHLDQSHGAASRRLPEIRGQVQVMVDWLGLAPAARLLDVTCGPGLYAAEFPRLGVSVTGVDFGPASLRYAGELCRELRASSSRATSARWISPARDFDAAIYIYGQFTVLKPAESSDVLKRIRAALRPGGRLLLEILDDTKFDKKDDTWWYTDTGGLWGDFRICTWASGAGIPPSARRSSGSTSSTWRPARCRSTACRIRRTPRRR